MVMFVATFRWLDKLNQKYWYIFIALFQVITVFCSSCILFYRIGVILMHAFSVLEDL